MTLNRMKNKAFWSKKKKLIRRDRVRGILDESTLLYAAIGIGQRLKISNYKDRYVKCITTPEKMLTKATK